MSRLQERLIAHEQRRRQALAFTVDKPDKKKRSKEELVKLSLALGVLLFIISLFVTVWSRKNYELAFQSSVNSLESKLERLDTMSQDKRHKLEEQYAPLREDPNWFDSTLDIERDIGYYTPRMEGLSDAPLIKNHNEKVWERNDQLIQSMRALREEQGAPPTLNNDLRKIDNVLEDAEMQLKEMQKIYPNEFRAWDSPLNKMKDAVGNHHNAREALANSAEDRSTEPDQTMLFNWRRAYRLRLEAAADREKSSN